MAKLVFQGVVAACAALALVSAECPNACTGNGLCTKFDVCNCNAGFIGNDCSDRVCPFGKAHVDGYLGDLNSDNQLTTLANAGQLYPASTNEKLTQTIPKSAHFYRECSNKGLCDRTAGTCDCFPGYEGSACGRASCPTGAGKELCSGNGVCSTVRELAVADSKNTYELWDADKGMACVCDAGHTGYDCSLKTCPIGVDPLYIDAVANGPRANTWTFVFDYGTNGLPTVGTFRIKFYDANGKAWITNAYDPWKELSDTTKTHASYLALSSAGTTLTNARAAQATSTTTLLVDATVAGSASAANTARDNLATAVTAFNTALGNVITQLNLETAAGNLPTFPSLFKNLPNSVVPVAPTCVYGATGFTGVYTAASTALYYTCTFSGNPGPLKIPAFVTTDGAGTATIVNAAGSTAAPGITTSVFDLGTTGEWTDYFAKSCGTVSIAVAVPAATAYTAETVTVTGNIDDIKTCLGTSDGTAVTALHSWDAGNNGITNPAVAGQDVTLPGQYPHLVKLVSTTANVYPLGLLAIMYLDTTTTTGVYKLLTKVPVGTYTIYSTSGVLARTFKDNAPTGFVLKNGVDTMAIVATTVLSSTVTSPVDIGCSAGVYLNCIDKGQLVVIPSTSQGDTAADGYTVANLASAAAFNTASLYKVVKYAMNSSGTYDITLDRPVMFTSAKNPIFLFTPDKTGTDAYTFAGECATRGLCDRTTGLCECFKGYADYNCAVQSALSV